MTEVCRVTKEGILVFLLKQLHDKVFICIVKFLLSIILISCATDSILICFAINSSEISYALAELIEVPEKMQNAGPVLNRPD